jgi:hypothetical protein
MDRLQVLLNFKSKGRVGAIKLEQLNALLLSIKVHWHKIETKELLAKAQLSKPISKEQFATYEL